MYSTGALILSVATAALHACLLYHLSPDHPFSNPALDLDYDEEDALFWQFVVSHAFWMAAQSWNLAGLATGCVGIFGFARQHPAAMRAFSLFALADLAVTTLAILTFGLLSFSPGLASHFSKALCDAITSGERSIGEHNHLTSWTGAIGIDGLEICEERWRIFGLLCLLLAVVGVMLQAHLVGATWQHYRQIMKRRNVLGHRTDTAGPLPAWLQSDCKSSTPLLYSRPRSHTTSAINTQTPKLVCFTSPYSLGPLSASASSPMLRPGGGSPYSSSMGHRRTHAHQPSENQVVVYAPVLIDMDDLSKGRRLSLSERPFVTGHSPFGDIKGRRESSMSPSRPPAQSPAQFVNTTDNLKTI